MSRCTDLFVEVTNVTKGNMGTLHINQIFPFTDSIIKTNSEG